jgi:cytochrome c-type biogenesis protein CcmH/NrfG
MKLRNFFGLVILGILIMLIVAPVVFSVDDPIVTADELYTKRANHQNVQQVIDLLQQYITEKPDNCDALWRLAKCYWYLGDHAVGKTKLALFSKGKEYAEQAVKTDPNNINGHYWLAALLGSTGEARGILQSLFMVSPMKKELDICIQLDNKFADAHDVLAQLYWKAPGPPLSIGNKKRAQEEAKLAVTNGPNTIDNWLHLGQIARDNRDYVTAREAFNQILNLPDDPEDPEQSQSYKAIATSELKKLDEKK